MEKLSAHDFPLKSSSQMARPEFAAANSFLAFSMYRTHLVSSMDDGACLLCVFVDTFVCVLLVVVVCGCGCGCEWVGVGDTL